MHILFLYITSTFCIKMQFLVVYSIPELKQQMFYHFAHFVKKILGEKSKQLSPILIY